MARILQNALDPRLQPQELIALCLDVAKDTLIPLAVLGGILMAVTLAIQLVVTGLGVSLKKLTPDPKRLDPLDRYVRSAQAEPSRTCFRR